MKKLMALAFLTLTSSAFAQGQALSAKTFSTFKSDPVVRQSGWIWLGKSPSSDFWYAHTSGNPAVVAIALKTAYRGIGNEYASIQIETGFVNCSEVPKDLFPLHLHSYSIESNDAQTGEGDLSNQFEPNAYSVPIVAGTVMGEIIKRSCLAAVKN